MSKDVVVIVRCDRCGGEDAQTYTEENSKGKPVEIDLDNPCHDQHEELKRQYAEAIAKAALILSPIVELADEKGVTPDKAGKGRPKAKPETSVGPGEGPRVCILCWAEPETDAKLKTHLQRDHGLGDSLITFYGSECPVDGEPFDRVAHHIRQGHKDLEFSHYSQAFVWAKKNGDPHGTLAKQIAAVQKLANAA